MWTFLNRPYLVSIAQFKDICKLYEFKMGIATNKKRQAIEEVPSFRSAGRSAQKLRRENYYIISDSHTSTQVYFFCDKSIYLKEHDSLVGSMH